MKRLKVLYHCNKNEICRYCNNDFTAFQCSVTYTMKQTIAFAMISLCVIAVLVSLFIYFLFATDNFCPNEASWYGLASTLELSKYMLYR